MTESKLFIDRSQVPDLSQLVQSFESMAFGSPFRSTVPLVSLVKDDRPRFQSILSSCGVPADAALHFEFTVPSGVEGANPSHTDVMALSGTVAGAMEAKWTEPRYESVARRLERRRTGDLDQEGVVSAWLDLLKPHARRKLVLADFTEVVYQTLHRAASACALSRAPRLVYLHFVPSPRGGVSEKQYLEDLSRLHRLLGEPPDFPFFLVEVTVERTAAFEQIAHLPKRRRATDYAVRSALVAEPLFAFVAHSIHPISPGS
jgi:hypothetical protein